MASNSLECDICCNMYSDDHCPRILPCTHEFCSHCIEGLIFTQRKECPLCRRQFWQNSAKELMINRGLLEATKQLSSMHLRSRPLASAPKKSILEFTKDFRENQIGRSIFACQETEAEVKARIESNREMRRGLLRFIQTLEKMKIFSEKTLSSIDQDNRELMNKLDIMQQDELNITESERKLETATDFASAGATIGKAGQILHGAEKTVSKIKQLLRENDRRRDNMRQDTLKIKKTFTEAMKDLGSIIEELEGGHSVIEIEATDLRSPHGHLRVDPQREIFAVMTFEGKLRIAPVKIEPNNQVSVPRLKDEVLPPKCFVIKVESLMPSGSPIPLPLPRSLPPPPRGFLDLAYGSTPLGRVVIRVTVNGLKGLNFLHMCAGGMGGLSYAHSRVSGVLGKGLPGEWISMGDYLSHGGGGRGGTPSTRAVLAWTRKEEWERERQNGTYEETALKAGDVRGDISYEFASQFCIVTRDAHPNERGRSCFGMVEDAGLEVLRNAISKYPDWKNIEVTQCGLII